jgi:virginiamycin A acetyltransferase
VAGNNPKSREAISVVAWAVPTLRITTENTPMKTLIKQLVEFAAFLAVLPAYGLYRIGAAIAGTDKAFPGWSETFSLLPGLTGRYLRRAFYSLTLKHCGENSCLSFGSTFSHPTASVGANVYVGSFCVLGGVTLEDDVLIASRVSIMNGTQQHGTARLDIPIREQPGIFTSVTIGEGSWIGEGATVSADVGKHCVIGAGAVVTKPIPDYAIAFGVPAKVVKFRNAELPIERQLAEAERLVKSATEAS